MGSNVVEEWFGKSDPISHSKEVGLLVSQFGVEIIIYKLEDSIARSLVQDRKLQEFFKGLSGLNRDEVTIGVASQGGSS